MRTLTESAVRCQIKNGRTCIYNSGKVYDVTDFMERHPGGKELLEDHVGQDVTQLMKSFSDHAHSAAAYKILDRYYIGDVRSPNGTVTKRKLANGTSKATSNGTHNGTANGTRTANGTANGHGHIGNGTANGSIVTKEEDSNCFQDGLVDWKKPVLHQVSRLGDKYFDWVHDPVDFNLRLFHSDVCELFSRAPWYLIPIYWIPVLSALCWYSFQTIQAQPPVWNFIGYGAVEVTASWFPALFIVGMFMWTLDEYVVHRWLFHMQPPGWSGVLITLHFILHGQHHKCPMDKTRLVFPVVPASMLGFIIYSVYTLFCPVPIAMVLFAGTIFGYMCYDLTHYYLHHGKPGLKYFQNLKTYHVKHHYTDQQNEMRNNEDEYPSYIYIWRPVPESC